MSLLDVEPGQRIQILHMDDPDAHARCKGKEGVVTRVRGVIVEVTLDNGVRTRLSPEDDYEVVG